MKVSELTGALLAYWVAKTEGKTPIIRDGVCYVDWTTHRVWCQSDPGKRFMPHEDWAQGGPIIDRERIGVAPGNLSWNWHALTRGNGPIIGPTSTVTGDTVLIAAMRAFVRSRFGDDVPDEAPT